MERPQFTREFKLEAVKLVREREAKKLLPEAMLDNAVLKEISAKK